MTIVEFNDWLENSITKKIFDILEIEREEMQDYLLHAQPDYQSKENCLMAVGKLIGSINAINSLLNITYEAIQPYDEEEDENDE
jgi:hypothetical protein